MEENAKEQENARRCLLVVHQNRTGSRSDQSSSNSTVRVALLVSRASSADLHQLRQDHDVSVTPDAKHHVTGARWSDLCQIQCVANSFELHELLCCILQVSKDVTLGVRTLQ